MLNDETIDLKKILERKLTELILPNIMYPISRSNVKIQVKNVDNDGNVSLHLGSCRYIEAMSIHNYLEKELKRHIHGIKLLNSSFTEI